MKNGLLDTVALKKSSTASPLGEQRKILREVTMLNRKPVQSQQSNNLFKRTADLTHKFNNRPRPMRGGITL